MIVQNYVRFNRMNRHAVESCPAVYIIAVCIDFGSFSLQNVNGQSPFSSPEPRSF